MNPSLELRSIHLRVAGLTRSVRFYTEQLGFVVARQSATDAQLAATADAPAILTLSEDRAAPPAPRDAAGLFHAALLLPSRAALGAWLRFAAERGTEFDGFSDHGVSEAIYLRDPENNGLEFYADRPRDAWPFDTAGQLAMVTAALDIDSLLASATPAPATPLAGARWGHLHLRVTNLARSDAFYRDTLGMALMQGTYPGARFLAADGYHHHVALNTWGHPRTPQPAGALGLAEATFARHGPAATQSLRDPDGIPLTIAPL
ncbi:MAG: VOC family protein [Verrucomicrobia bacterium]|nr:VOC family protein [Verrucomicrobiota bacterium]